MARSLRAAPDLELLERWRAGEPAAGEELGRRYFGVLRGFFATKCGGDAVELARRTLLVTLRAEGPGGDRSGFRTHLFTLARHELYRHLEQRHQGRRVDFARTSVAELTTAGRGAGREDERS